MKNILAAVSLLLLTGAESFSVKLTRNPSGVPPRFDEKMVRTEQKKVVEAYTDNDRLSWVTPKDTSLRHDHDMAPLLGPQDRVIRGNENTILPCGSHAKQDYPIKDREWGFPDEPKVRHEPGQAPRLEDNERLWNKPKPGQTLHP
jgi:hypothetical protein